MNLRCFYCQTPFTVGRPEMLAALQRIEAENLNHYDAHCPRCRRANSVSRERMEMFFPNWRQVAAEEQAGNPSEPSPTSPEAASQPVDEQPIPPTPPTAPAPLVPQPPAEIVPARDEMETVVRKPARKRSRAAKKTKVTVTKKTAAKATKKTKATITLKKTASKSKAKTTPAAKKTAAKKKKK